MTRARLGSVVAGVAAAGFFGTAALHSTGYSSVVRLAADVPSDLGRVMPALWLAFSLDLAVIGGMVALVAWKRPDASSLLLFVAALQPFGAALLQVWTIGFVPPTAILLAVSLATVGAAVLFGRSSAQAT